jgi:hypothetical protein
MRNAPSLLPGKAPGRVLRFGTLRPVMRATQPLGAKLLKMQDGAQNMRCITESKVADWFLYCFPDSEIAHVFSGKLGANLLSG